MDFEKRKLEKENQKQKFLIENQMEEIDLLKEELNSLQIDNDKKDNIIEIIDKYQTDMEECIVEINKQKEEYEKLIAELRTMYDTMNETIFNKKWKVIKFLMGIK